MFRAVQKLQELFRAGAVYLSSGSGAYALYQFDRREVLRYTGRDRLAAYRRAFGYGRGAVPTGSRAKTTWSTSTSTMSSASLGSAPRAASIFWAIVRGGSPARARIVSLPALALE